MTLKLNQLSHAHVLLYAYKQALKSAVCLIRLIPSGLGYCALNINWCEVEENSYSDEIRMNIFICLNYCFIKE